MCHQALSGLNVHDVDRLNVESNTLSLQSLKSVHRPPHLTNSEDDKSVLLHLLHHLCRFILFYFLALSVTRPKLPLEQIVSRALYEHFTFYVLQNVLPLCVIEALNSKLV